MTFLGHVIAPTFEFVDPNDSLKVKPEINFGKVSYDFDYKEGIILKNTSSVEFTYNLKILSENKILQNEFRIHPQSGTIPEKSEKLIEIEFNPKSIKKYETVMTIDIEGVGNDMLSVPIKADCQIPNVEITPA
jgi:hydrocephalus-inducing protein